MLSRKTITPSSGKRESSSLIKSILTNILSQAASSGTNLLLGIYFARTLALEDFGLYGVGFSACLFIGGLGNSLILVNMTIKIPQLSPKAKKQYAADTLALLLFFLLAIMTISAIATQILSTHIDFVGANKNIIYAATIASCLYLAKDFFLRYAYSQFNESLALKINCASAISTSLTILFVELLGVKTNSVHAIYILGLGFGFGVVLGSIYSKLPLGKSTISNQKNIITDSWLHARWGVTANIISWTRTQAYTFFSLSLSGAKGVAILNAARILITPAIFLISPIGQIMLPRLAALAIEDRKRAATFGLLTTVVLFMFCITYSLIVLAFIDPLATIALGGNYKNIESSTIAWILFLSISTITTCSTLTLQALKEFPIITYASFLATAVMLLAIFPFNSTFGTTGIIYSMAAGELAIAIITTVRILKIRKNHA